MDAYQPDHTTASALNSEAKTRFPSFVLEAKGAAGMSAISELAACVAQFDDGLPPVTQTDHSPSKMEKYNAN